MKKILSFGIILSTLVLMLFSGKSFAADPKNTSCRQSFTAAFDAIDASHQQILSAYLDSPEGNKVTGADSVEFLAPLMGNYNCQLKMACYLIGEAGQGLKNAGGNDWENQKFPFPECAASFTFINKGGQKSTEPATWGAALKSFGVSDQFSQCAYNQAASPSDNLAPWQECGQLRQTKLRIELSKISTNLEYSARQKRAGFLLAKLEELHRKLNPEGGGGLVQLANDFVRKFKSVLVALGCTIPTAEQRN